MDTSATELQPSGWSLAGVPTSDVPYPVGRLVADGTGQVWFLGPWQLIRLDPQSGETTIWDAVDDLQFTSTTMKLAPAGGAAVWLLDGGRVRQFDGARFAADLEVPSDIRNIVGGPTSDGWVTDVVEVGSDLWVSVVDAADVSDGQGLCCQPHAGSGGRVARFSNGTWTAMSAPAQGVGGSLAVDRDGAVWAGGVILPSNSGDQRVGGIRRWDGREWSLPGAEGAAAPTESGEVAGDPAGGVWVVSGTLRHFDGRSWTVPVSSLYSLLDEALAVDPDGDAWLAGGIQQGGEGLLRVSPDGRTQMYGTEAGYEGSQGLALGAGDSVVISASTAVQRLEGERLENVWQFPPTIRVEFAEALSADEVWVQAEGTWFRLRDGAWDELGAGSSCAPTATDGGLWTTSSGPAVDYPGGGQLAHISSDGYSSVGDRPVTCGYGAALSTNPDGSVWALQSGEVVRYWPDGQSRSIGRPESVDPPPDRDEWGAESAEQICLHGVDPTGSVWVSEYAPAEDDQECTAGTWHRWDGRRWIAEDSPDPFTSAPEHVVAGDGIGWVLRAKGSATDLGARDGAADTELARYAEGEIAPVATKSRMGSLALVSGGRACVFEYLESGAINPSAIVCYDAHGEFARFDVATRAPYPSQYDVAPDGSIWLVGPQVARLSQTLPPP